MAETITPAASERIARLVSAGLELGDSFAAFVKEVSELAVHDYARLILLDEQGETCRVAAEHGAAPGASLATFTCTGSGVEAAIKAGKPVHVLLDTGSPPGGLVREFTRALLLPLTFQEQGIGAVELYSKDQAGLKVSRKQEDALASLGYFFSAIVRNAALYTQLATRSEQLANALERAAIRSAEFESVISQMVDGVAITDLVGRIVRLNSQGEQILGRPAAPTADITVHAEVYQLYTTAGEPYPTERLPLYTALNDQRVVRDVTIMVRRPDRQERAIVVSAAPLQDSEGKISGGLMVLRDVTEVREAERIRDEFMANISHELRTPLTSILGYSDIMMRRANLDERGERQLEAIRSNAQRLLSLINDLLDVSRLETGAIGLQFRSLDVAAAISYALTYIQPLANSKNVQLSQYVMQPLPLVWVDEQRVQQIFINLLSNAIKFTPAGGSVSVRASLLTPEQAKGERAMLAVQVTDSGIGLAPDQLERVWERFYQVDSASNRSFGGTGLGLAITKRLVELHGGRIIATSKGVGEGATFTFTLPLADERDGHHPPAPLQRVGEYPIPHHQPPSPEQQVDEGRLVLIVEDDPDFGQILTTLLRDEGYRTVTVSDGQQAAKVAEQMRLDLITLDINLPRADGWSVLNQLKVNPATAAIPIVVISVVDNQRFGFSLGASEYLVKPVEREQLFSVVQRLLGPHQAEQTIMVVEDDPHMRAVLHEALTEQGWLVSEAENGKLALERIAAAPPDLVLLDLMLPLIDGFEVLRRLRQSPDPRIRDLPVLVLTAKTLTPAEQEQLQAAQRTMHKANLEQEPLVQEVVRNIKAIIKPR